MTAGDRLAAHTCVTEKLRDNSTKSSYQLLEDPGQGRHPIPPFTILNIDQRQQYLCVVVGCPVVVEKLLGARRVSTVGRIKAPLSS